MHVFHISSIATISTAESRGMTVYGERIRVRDPNPDINHETEDHHYEAIPANLNAENTIDTNT